MLTVEINQKDEMVEIHCDSAGLAELIYQLTVLQQSGGHVHLKTAAWGGGELSDVQQGRETLLVHHLAIGLQRASVQ